jgi:hypothetical protein
VERNIVRLSPGDELPGDFYCGDADLDDFFCREWRGYCTQLMAVTYAVLENGRLIAMFSVVNDRVESEDFRKGRRRILGRIAYPKRLRRHFPSVKLARLGVIKERQGGQGIGAWILEFLKAYFVLNNKTGCRYLTVDSYGGKTGFYEKNGFEKFDPDKTERPDDYVYMHYDLQVTRNMLRRDPDKLAYMKALIDEVTVGDSLPDLAA